VKPGTKDADAASASAVAAYCHREGVLVLTAGTYGNVIRLLVPLVITDEQMDEGLDVLESALAAVWTGQSAIAEVVTK